MIVYIPVAVEEAVRLRDGGTLPDRLGYAATPTLLQAAGFAPAEVEDAGITALSHAWVQSLITTGNERRLVLAVDAESITDLTDPYGAVRVSNLTWDRVWALYLDEPDAAPAVDKAVAAIHAGSSLSDALARPEVDALLNDHDLLWFDPTELDRLP